MEQPLAKAIIDGGNFDWMAHADKFRDSVHRTSPIMESLMRRNLEKEGAFITKCTSQLMRDLGCAQSPQSAFILNLGLESLHVRMPRHVEMDRQLQNFWKSMIK